MIHKNSTNKSLSMPTKQAVYLNRRSMCCCFISFDRSWDTVCPNNIKRLTLLQKHRNKFSIFSESRSLRLGIFSFFDSLYGLSFIKSIKLCSFPTWTDFHIQLYRTVPTKGWNISCYMATMLIFNTFSRDVNFWAIVAYYHGHMWISLAGCFSWEQQKNCGIRPSHASWIGQRKENIKWDFAPKSTFQFCRKLNWESSSGLAPIVRLAPSLP